MSDLKVALDELKEESDSGKLMAVLPAKKSVLRLAVAASIVVAICVLAAFAAQRLLFSDREVGIPGRPIPLTSYQGDERQPDFSPDGSQVAFAWNGEKQDNWDIYLKVVGSSAAPLRLTTDPGSDSEPKWSPDGKSIAFVRSTSGTDAVMLTSALGGAEQRLAFFNAGISWSRDGK